ncbi:MAG: serine hydrolase [Gemmatimonadaceae bacterium]|nr:serine hydrolase [Gemmatimonadaceae bacterium]
MRRLLLATTVASLCTAPNALAQRSPAQGASAQRPDLAAFDAYVAQAVKAWNLPGLAIAVVANDSMVFAKGYGVRTLGRPEPVDAHTRFAIGSTTKAMTSLALLQASDEGAVSLDQPVLRYLPTLQLYDPVMTREITVRDLLTHHTGLPGSDQLWTGGDYGIDEIIRRMRFLRPVASFRNHYAYQNVQYAMAGEVLRAGTGKAWADWLKTRIWEPLGMRETLPTVAATEGEPNVASPHEVIDDTMRVIANRAVDPVAPAGSVWSSVSDMAKWMRFVLDSGRVGGRRLVSERAFNDWLSPQVVVPVSDFYPTSSLASVRRVNYGLGWFLHNYGGDEVAMHTGSIDGMSAIIGLIPERRVGVYILANSDHAELRHALMFRAFDLFNGRRQRDWSGEVKTLFDGLDAAARAQRTAFEKSRVAGTRPSLALEGYAGTYADSLNGTVVVSVRDGALRVVRGKGFAGRLEHWHYDTFVARWDDRRSSLAPVTFSLDARGRVTSLRIGAATFGRAADGASR